MEAYGPVDSVTLIRERGTGQSKGQAFIKFTYREDAITAFQVKLFWR